MHRNSLVRGSLLLLMALPGAATAGPILYTFGADLLGAPTSLNSMDPSSAASVTNVQTPVGDGSIGFTGGLVGVNGLLYAIGNDSLGNSTLYSMDKNGQDLTAISSDFNTSGDANGFGFINGLGAIGDTFYAIGVSGGVEELFQIGAGSATEIRALPTLAGTYAGMAYDPVLGQFFALLVNTSGDHRGDLLVQFGLTGGATIAANLTSLDGADAGSHLSGIADAGGGILYDIYMSSSTFTGQLERIDVNGAPSTTTLYDTNIPLAQNAGIAILNTPEPAPAAELAFGLLTLGAIVRRRLTRN